MYQAVQIQTVKGALPNYPASCIRLLQRRDDLTMAENKTGRLLEKPAGTSSHGFGA
jgi:hypothetical protein